MLGKRNLSLSRRYSVLIALILIFMTGVMWGELRRTLSTKFTDVILSGMEPGMVYSLKQEKKVPYKVENGTDKPAEVEVISEKPSSSQLKEGYEPIPEVSWVKVTPNRFRLEPGESTDCDIIISIPKDDRYANRHYQAMIVTQTLEEPDSSGIALSFALASRIRFSTGKTPLAVMQEYRNKVLEVLNIDMMPLSLNVGEVPVGEYINLDGEEYPTVQLINRGKEEYTIKYVRASNPVGYGLARGYEAAPLDVSVKFKKQKIKLKRRMIEDIKMRIEIPDKEEYYGKSYAVVILSEIQWENMPVNLYSRIYFKTEKKMSSKRNEK